MRRNEAYFLQTKRGTKGNTSAIEYEQYTFVY